MTLQHLLKDAIESEDESARASVSIECRRLFPNMLTDLLCKAESNRKGKNPLKARKYFELVLAIDPKNNQALIGLDKLASSTRNNKFQSRSVQVRETSLECAWGIMFAVSLAAFIAIHFLLG